MPEMIASDSRPSEDATDSQTETTTTLESNDAVCPHCGNHSIERSETCYADVLDLPGSTTATGASLDLSGQLCTAHGCEWFQLDRQPETPYESAETSVPAPGAGKIALPEGETAYVSDDEASVDGESGTYLDRDSCPKCGSHLTVYIQRIHPDRREDACEDLDEVVEYKAYAEECTRNNCSHRKP